MDYLLKLASYIKFESENLIKEENNPKTTERRKIEITGAMRELAFVIHLINEILGERKDLN